MRIRKTVRRMARNKLTDTTAKRAKPGWHGDGDGLWLRVNPSGIRSWFSFPSRLPARNGAATAPALAT